VRGIYQSWQSSLQSLQWSRWKALWRARTVWLARAWVRRKQDQFTS